MKRASPFADRIPQRHAPLTDDLAPTIVGGVVADAPAA
jgi:hypothetical protein